MVYVESEEDKKAREQLKTVPVDARFPNQNISYYCFQMYVDYQRCIQLFNPEHQPCTMFQDYYKVLCPNAWIDRWDDQLKTGTFPVRLPNDCKHPKAKVSS